MNHNKLNPKYTCRSILIMIKIHISIIAIRNGINIAIKYAMYIYYKIIIFRMNTICLVYEISQYTYIK